MAQVQFGAGSHVSYPEAGSATSAQPTPAVGVFMQKMDISLSEAPLETGKKPGDLKVTRVTADVQYTLEGCKELARLINLHGPEEEKRQKEHLESHLLTQEELTQEVKIVGPKEGQTATEWIGANRGKLQEIVYLNLGSRGLSALPAEFALLSNLRVLELRSNEFTEFPEVVTKLFNLEYLSLFKTNGDLLHELNRGKQDRKYKTYEDCQMAVPAAIGQLIKLIVLDLRFMGLKSLPKEINQLSLLEVLLLKTNYIKELEIGNLKKLKHLHLGENPWQRLTSGLSELAQLTHVDFDEVVRPAKWKEVGVEDNKAKWTELFNALLKIPNLTFLDISKNELQSRPYVEKEGLKIVDKNNLY